MKCPCGALRLIPFIFDQYFSEETMQGMALEIVVDKDDIIETSENIIVELNKFYQPSL